MFSLSFHDHCCQLQWTDLPLLVMRWCFPCSQCCWCSCWELWHRPDVCSPSNSSDHQTSCQNLKKRASHCYIFFFQFYVDKLKLAYNVLYISSNEQSVESPDATDVRSPPANKKPWATDLSFVIYLKAFLKYQCKDDGLSLCDIDNWIKCLITSHISLFVLNF